MCLFSLHRLLPFPPTVLKRAIKDHGYNIPEHAIDEIISVSDGDMRSAIQKCHLYEYLPGHDFCKFLRSNHSDLPLNLFHALGKIIYPRKVVDGVDYTHLYGENYVVFNMYLHQNCYQNMENIADISTISESFSFCNNLLSSLTYQPSMQDYHHIPGRCVAMTVNGPAFKRSGYITMRRPQGFDFRNTGCDTGL